MHSLIVSFFLSGYKITYDLSIDIVTSVRILTVTFNDRKNGPSLQRTGDHTGFLISLNSSLNNYGKI